MTFILVSLLLSAGLFIALNYRTLQQRGRERFGSNEVVTKFFQRRASQRSSRADFPHLQVQQVKTHNAALFESARCDLCGGFPRVQYRSRVTDAVLEFCGHHAERQHDALTAQSFFISVDER